VAASERFVRRGNLTVPGGIAPRRRLKYRDALSEGLVQGMERDSSIFVAGIAVDYPSGIFGTTAEACRRFGPDRVFDVPAMENALTGIAIGAAAMGKRPVVVHPRADFLFLALDQMANLAAKWSYMFGGRAGRVPIVVRAIIGKGWGQGATHSQSPQSVFAHFPGLNVLMPAFPDDAKGLTLAALVAPSPTLILEHRALFETEGEVAETVKPTPMGCARIVRAGKDVSVVATSLMAVEAVRAAEALEGEGVSVEVVDPRSIRPLDVGTIVESVRKTGRLVIADTSWALCGFSAEVAAIAAEQCVNALRAPVRRITLADCPAPVSLPLEQAFYPGQRAIIDAVLQVLGKDPVDLRLGADPGDDFVGSY
jgi:acetoin:2,6-dichlorophenolindophenol oxidoreductase subunit beta